MVLGGNNPEQSAQNVGCEVPSNPVHTGVESVPDPDTEVRDSEDKSVVSQKVLNRKNCFNTGVRRAVNVAWSGSSNGARRFL